MAEGYNKQEVARGEEGDALTVNVSLNVISFLEVNEIDQTLKVVMEIERTWFDSQLTLLHVQEDSNLNTLWEENYERIWYPKILFENIDLTKSNAERYKRYTIVRDMNFAPTVRDPGSKNTTNVFRGSDHKIVRTQEYTYYWRCVYNLKWYPFDYQTCKMGMNLPGHYRDIVILNPEAIHFSGNKEELTKYSVDKLVLCSKSNRSQLVFEVTFNRPLMNSILTIYIPTLLLLVIRYGQLNA